MGLLLNLYLGHLVGDFVLQPGWLVAAKRRGAPGIVLHGAVIGICTALLLYADLAELIDVVLFATAAHLAIELATIRLRSGTHASGLSVFIVDQALHLVTLVLLVRLVSPWTEVESLRTLGYELGPATLAALCAFIAVSFMGSIIVMEVVNVWGPDAARKDILGYDVARVYGMTERGSALALSLLVHPALMLAPFVPRVARALISSHQTRSSETLTAATGLVVAALGWAFVVGVTLAIEAST
jgi:hypothetical protein